MEVSVRELKAHLSKYLRVVEEGEAVVVTRHDVAVARLEPIQELAEPDAVARLASAAGVSWGGGKPAGARVRLEPGGGTASDAVLEDRR